MSSPVSALGGASFSEGIARIDEVALQGMITLRGDLSDPVVQKTLKPFGDGDLPAAGEARIEADRGLAWMSPDEMLVLCPYAAAAETVAALQEALGDAHALVVDVSDARASFVVSGPQARDVLAKLCPVDFSPAAFSLGMFRRTRMAQVPAAIWPRQDGALQLICFRSQARYVFDLLSVAAQAGSEVGMHVQG